MRALVVAALVILLSTNVHAQTTPVAGGGFDSHLFRPAVDSKGFFAVNGADVMPGGHISTGLVIDYGHNILRASPPVVRSAFAGTFHFDYGIADRAIVGISLPAILMSGPNGLDVQSIQHAALQGKVKVTDFLAVVAQVGVPVSEAAKSGGADPSIWFWPRLVVEERFDKLRVALEGGWRGHGASDSVLGLDKGRYRDGSLLTYGAAASYRIFEPVDVVAETYATYLLNSSSAAVRPSNEVLGGIKVFVEKSSFLMLGAGPRYTSGFEAADFRATIGFVFEPRMEPRSGSGSRDEERAPVDTVRLPLPDPPPPPSPADYDKDGIPDAEDACPTQFGKPHSDPKWNGCPDIKLGPNELFFFQKIHFETNSAKILPESNPLLDELAKVLEEHLELALIEVAGHADERGSERLNLNLTQARVESVVRALIERKVDKKRLRAKGYGYYCPLEEGHDESAWSQNRRVELKIVKTTSGPTNAPLGCEKASARGVKPDPIPE